MSSGETIRVPRAIRSQWREWTAIVALFAQRQPGRHHVSKTNYQKLHGELLSRCQEKLASAEDRCPLYQRMAELARPWRSVESLDAAEAEIARDLFDECREVQRVLGDRPAAARQARARLLPALSVGAAVAAAAVWMQAGDTSPWNLHSWSVALRRSWRFLVQAVGASDHSWILGGGIVAVGMAIVLVWTSRGRR
ncbi:MAG: hypothetical protein ACOX1P_25410 [Thermoguttaceae bacterium]